MIEEHYHNEPLRLLGVGVSNLKKEEDLPKEYNLFTIENIEERKSAINTMIQQFQEKYGEKALFQNKKKTL